ncbi:hypothetical protein ACR2R6_00875 [Methylocaldum gracile subsp. desertum]|uniref:hypothetical protein n=1 Tax=Methylocaldum sp. GT1BW TaxID=3438964 RepID=UPI003D9FFEF2
MDIVESINRFLSAKEREKGVRTRMTKARDEIVFLRSWIKEEEVRSNTCTYYVLGEVCENCACSRNQSNVRVNPRAKEA